MEVKKSSKANLENRQTQGFLLGVIWVLAMLFVALEYDYTSSGDEYDAETL